MRQVLRIGSRASRLALWQAEFIKGLITRSFPGLKIGISVIRTTGDRIADLPISEIGGKELFVKEIEEALLRNEIDVAVHSLKDLPTVLPDGLRIGAVGKRHDPRDALVSKEGIRFYEFPKGARIGTGSVRRQAQLLYLRPDLQIIPIRGNVDTRLRKLRNEGFDGVVLALAGLERMGFHNEVTEVFSFDILVPAPGQGVIAVECREYDDEISRMLVQINHEETQIAASAERAFLERLGGSCHVPVGCFAEIKEDSVKILGLIASPDGKQLIREDIEGSVQSHKSLGKELAERILKKGGEEILSRLPS
ncbi:MAG: hydroxymethylbilane synthase [Deltaproteobacteria bacterium]|nr:hydroxymethylbilane synthase [Deltaproteobacteria bacterium]